MAKEMIWEMLEKYFSPDEFGEGAEEGMDDGFLASLYQFRVAMDNPILIHNNGGYGTEGHSPKSYHYKGRAIDFHFKHRHNVSLRKFVVTALRCGLYGIGMYPLWSPKPGGFHLDNRPGGMFNIWSKNDKGLYTYLWPSSLPESLEEWRDQ
jgi:hypothetical protein